MSMMEEDYISDEVRKLLLNEYYEIIIGSDLYVQQSKDLEIVIKDADSSTRDIYRDLEKGSNDLTEEHYNDKVTITENSWSVLGFFNDDVPVIFQLGPNVPPPTCVVTGYSLTGMITSVGDCLSRAVGVMTSLKETCINDNGTPSDPNDDTLNQIAHPGDWTIDWGDGNIDTRDGFSSYSPSHIYSSDGVYSITITVTFIDVNGTELTRSEGLSVDIDTSDSCLSKNTDASDFVEGDDSVFGVAGYAIGVKIWKKQDIFGSHAGAFTHSWRFDEGRAKWKRQLGQNWVEIYANWRDSNCMEHDNDFEGDVCSLCKRQRAAVSTGWHDDYYSDGDIHSDHRLTNYVSSGAVEITASLELEGCN
jgi:hypothetical protein